MSHSNVLRRSVHGLAVFLLHFAHGGLLALGLAFMLVIVLALAGEGHLVRHPWRLGGAADGAQTAEQTVAVSAAAPAGGEMRGVIEYVSRRYRVAASAVEPLVRMAQAAAARTGVDPLLILAVMAVESGFNPIAESPLGAQGLMQVMPRFHQDKLDEVAGMSLLDPAANIHVGARILKESIRRAGSLEEGLRLYAGAASDDEGRYAARVLAERQRLEAAAGRHRGEA